ncbi:SurA N-terminal domain-containing protein [Caloranaerobacter azorensis]|uniref:SurA N-terminal domain-containing protein n=1 Tax=Caloranaerobacter azorensis TaxID=116090 RepID=UPI0018CEB945|nr:SurA N-terminal domain-containing protein [Caloranaerobacter azorensis]
MKNVKFITIITIVLSLLLLGVAVGASKIDSLDIFKKELKEIGTKVKDIEQDKTSRDVVLEIGDEAITLQRFKTVGAMLKTEDKNKITDFIVKHVLIKKLAREKGITVSDNEVKEYIQQIRTFIDNNDKAKEKFNVFLESFGFTEEEFWSSDRTFEIYKSALLEGKYREIFREEFRNKCKDKTSGEIERLVEKRIDELIKHEKEKIKVKMYFDKFK